MRRVSLRGVQAGNKGAPVFACLSLSSTLFTHHLMGGKLKRVRRLMELQWHRCMHLFMSPSHCLFYPSSHSFSLSHTATHFVLHNHCLSQSDTRVLTFSLPCRASLSPSAINRTLKFMNCKGPLAYVQNSHFISWFGPAWKYRRQINMMCKLVCTHFRRFLEGSCTVNLLCAYITELR